MRRFILFYFLIIASKAADTITRDSPLTDGQTIVSADGYFELGFFRPGNSANRYVGIWYNKIVTNREVVWVANRKIPLNDTSGTLMVSDKGILQLNSSQGVIWSSNSSTSLMNPVAQLLDNGNLVLRDGTDRNPEHYAWQSFDYPSNTLLPGMKLGHNLVTGLERSLTSWESSDDPSPGEFSLRLDISGYPQVVLWQGTVLVATTGPWNGQSFSAGPSLRQNPYFRFRLEMNDKEIYYAFELVNTSVPSRLMVNQAGIVQRLVWTDGTQGWLLYSTGQTDICDRYSLCGPFGKCNINQSPPSPTCVCLRGFKPKFPQQWKSGDWSRGCVRNTTLECGTRDKFQNYTGVKSPDTRRSWFDKTIGLDECQRLCLKNCACVAYSNLDIRNGGSGCLLWFNELNDIREFPGRQQADLYVRVAASEIDVIGPEQLRKAKSPAKRRMLIAIISTVSVIIVLGSVSWYAIRRKRMKRGGREEEQDMELPLFDLITIATATENFSTVNLIGEGGFGPVYWGKLSNGQEIAVKKLSKHSGQGLEELKNEIILISRLQHRNLVRLQGCCLEGEQRMLIYEYMPNSSLDSIIFDESKKRQLSWENRFHIAMGISRGLLYLHQDSRLRIIHRDLKSSNILLDSELNPKISDFGLARIFGGDQIEASTKRVMGTYGYISPEYAVDGKFSVKSDVFSFGVVLLEIVSGRKNWTFRHSDHHHNLLGHAWLLWNEGEPLELLDVCLKGSAVESQVLRCIHVGLLCVQKLTVDRPTMASVVFMLSHEEVALPPPKEPGFFIERSTDDTDESNEKRWVSANASTISILEPR